MNPFPVRRLTLSLGIAVIALCPGTPAGATAISTANIGSLDTGASGPGPGDTVAVDPNWTVSTLGIPSPAGPLSNAPTYVAPDSVAGQVGTGDIPEWLPNDATSSWISFSNPIYDGTDNGNETFQYQTVFTPANNATIDVNFLSDNVGSLIVNGVLLGSNASNPYVGSSTTPNTFGLWLSAPLSFPVLAGTAYTVDMDVNNIPNGTNLNPSGVRVELNDPAAPNVVAAPDGGCTLMLLGVASGCAGMVRNRFRRA